MNGRFEHACMQQEVMRLLLQKAAAPGLDLSQASAEIRSAIASLLVAENGPFQAR